jgi:hypothetical protein
MMNEDGQLSLGGELSAREVTETEAIVRIKEALASNPELPVISPPTASCATSRWSP